MTCVQWLVDFAIAFGAILIVELPDKTLVASLVLSTRFQSRPVLVGVAGAFAVQCLIAVTAGGLMHLLPHRVLTGVVAGLFALGAVLLIRESLAEPDPVELAAQRENTPFRSAALTSFGVVFAAEWGDASQLATAALVARLGYPVAVGIGAWLALVTVAAIAVVAGRVVLRLVPLRLVHRVAGVAFAVFALVALIETLRG
jgi:putative Ca2+/H+ antiporter (TMEM165/GDT1 family)